MNLKVKVNALFLNHELRLRRQNLEAIGVVVHAITHGIVATIINKDELC